jgi:hypothetical protein
MSFKNYKKGLKRVQDQAIENSSTLFRATPFPKAKGIYNPWWNRQRHPGWAAYHANKDKV